MSCRFLFFFLILIEKSFSSVHIPTDRYRLQYSPIRKDSNQIIERIKRRTTSDIFQIHIHYDKSVEKYKKKKMFLFSLNFLFFLYRLLKNEQKLIKEAVEAATDYWSKAIRPKYKLNDRIRLTRY